MSAVLDQDLAVARLQLLQQSCVSVLVARRGAPVVAGCAGLSVVFAGGEPAVADAALLASLRAMELSGVVHVDWPRSAFAPEPIFSPDIQAVAAALAGTVHDGAP